MPRPATDLPADIQTPRLLLRTLDSHFLKLCLCAEQDEAADYLGCQLPARWFAQWRLMAIKLQDLKFEPDSLPWSLRAIIHKESKQMIGQIGFHTAPNPDYLRAHSCQGIELGYEVYEGWRRQGLAREALQAMLGFAKIQGVKRFVLSISPDNPASTGLALSFGFTKFGEQHDEEDGLEYQYQLLATQLPLLDWQSGR
ncbi:MAG: GNAT family N-acetyltransferase [Aeromonadaceae bacterium]